MTVTNSFSGSGNFAGLLIQAGTVSGPNVDTGAATQDAAPERLAVSIEEALTTSGEPVTLTRGEYQALGLLLDHLAGTQECRWPVQPLADRLRGR
ncbi:hypothetical protein [Kitasatospora sp. NRRL B-11411]|uniref:hypothetical protein n=1 Tax=Kitasatospora sp. NRRL B-11411 TaxID=1463822 RepID=UPI0004C2B666|nr:hypothetical protein [Kitasatospora sp. NRRL B-11411]